jgi:hypothetical protein
MRVIREQETRMWEFHEAAARRREATAAVAPDDNTGDRINAIAERFYAAARREPRVRRV